MAGTTGINSLGLVVEYSTEVPPTTASVWNVVPEVKGLNWNPVGATQIPFTHLGSTEVEYKLGLRSKGTLDVTGNFSSKHTATTAIIGLDASKVARWWRVTYSKQLTASTNGAREVMAGFVDKAAVAPGNTEAPVDFTFTVQVQSDYAFTAEA
jgi:hypothetical protein